MKFGQPYKHLAGLPRPETYSALKYEAYYPMEYLQTLGNRKKQLEVVQRNWYEANGQQPYKIGFTTFPMGEAKKIDELYKQYINS